MAFNFKGFIWKQFPDFFHQTDTYKDGSNKGIFQRYTTLFDDYLEDELNVFIGQVLDILSPKTTPEKFFPYLAYMLGKIPLVGSSANKRDIIRWAKTLYSYKGTIDSYKIIFNYFNYNVEVVNQFGPRPIKYDQADYPINRYDTVNTNYDQKEPGCNTILLAYSEFTTPLGNISTTISPTTLEAIKALVCLVNPIDVTVGAYIKLLRVEDNYSLTNTINELTPFGATCSVATNLGDGISPGSFNAPLAFSANHTTDTLSLTWAPPIPQVDTVLSYEVEYFESTANPLTNWAALSTTNLSIQHGVIGGLDYDIRVRAVYAKGKSEWVYLLSSYVPPPVCSLANNIQVVNYL